MSEIRETDTFVPTSQFLDSRYSPNCFAVLAVPLNVVAAMYRFRATSAVSFVFAIKGITPIRSDRWMVPSFK